MTGHRQRELSLVRKNGDSLVEEDPGKNVMGKEDILTLRNWVIREIPPGHQKTKDELLILV